jgi:hypothetical protein
VPIFSKNEYLEEVKQPINLKPNSKQERKVLYRVPAFEKPERYGDLESMHPILQLIAKTFSATSSRGIFMISYRLDCFIKHESRTEFGEGNKVSFPIVIRQVATKLYILKLYQDQLLEAFASEFNPTNTYPMVICGVTVDDETGEVIATCEVEGTEETGGVYFIADKFES